jgi:hypothetical protein
MSKKSDGLIADMMGNRWSFTATATNATTTPEVVAAPQSAKEDRHLDFFHWTITSKNTLSFTIAGSIRDASIAGTVLAQWPVIIGASQIAQVAPAGIHLRATSGKGLFFTTDTVQPSVTSTVNAAGWTDSATDH